MTKINPTSPFLVLALLLSIAATATLAAALGRGNTTRTTDSMAGDEEFMMESETTRRLLVTTISPSAQNPKKPFCNAHIYNNCINKPNTNYDKRPCNLNNSCKRPGS
ncbi:hypothetical protein C2S52_019268 [Perilla frutescens var. hirtella]|nr:hypothetical protein C2S52_019268 [Perilla frutescens var. hirtella]KAH6806443.1 hypothetical protein C2S51_031274 [Perilla frutescens var. frutescens]